MKKLISMLIAMILTAFSVTTPIQNPEISDTSAFETETSAQSSKTLEIPMLETESSSKMPEMPETTTFETESLPVLLNQNTLQTSTRFSIHDDGVARVYVDYTGYEKITLGAQISVTLEKQTDDDAWEQLYRDCFSVEGTYYYDTLTYLLSEKGIYRCRVVYQISGISGNDDIITFENSKMYEPLPETDVTPEEKPLIEIPPLVSLSANAIRKHYDFKDGFVFVHRKKGEITNDLIFGERYVEGDFCGIYTYQNGDMSAKLFCETEHSTFFCIGDTLYLLESGKIRSLLPNGTWQTEWQSEDDVVLIGNEQMLPLYAVGWRNYLIYGPYIYITANSENGDTHVLLYNTNEKTLRDLTADTGNFIHYEWIYENTLYGYNKDRSALVAFDLFLQEERTPDPAILSVFSQDFRVQMVKNTEALGILYDENGNRLGIMSFDFATKESIFLSNKRWDTDTLMILQADDTHIYFLDAKNRHAIYRVNRDGSHLQKIYENESMYICAQSMIVSEESVLLYAQEIGNIGGKVKHYADGWYRGMLDADGNIVSLTYLEAE